MPKESSLPWLSLRPHKRVVEKFFLQWSVVWISFVASIVVFRLYDDFNAYTYVATGLATTLPVIIIPIARPFEEERALPFFDRYSTKVNSWVLINSLLANHFNTHYFYSLLGMHYTVPTLSGTLTVNRVPICMHLLTHAYFLTYHIGAGVLLRRFQSRVSFALALLSLAYLTAFLETLTISSFPHYRYPDYNAMLWSGSVFYALMFVVSFPLFLQIDPEHSRRSTTYRETLLNAFATCMLTICAFDLWRLLAPSIMPGMSVSESVPFVEHAKHIIHHVVE